MLDLSELTFNYYYYFFFNQLLHNHSLVYGLWRFYHQMLNLLVMSRILTFELSTFLKEFTNILPNHKLYTSYTVHTVLCCTILQKVSLENK